MVRVGVSSRNICFAPSDKLKHFIWSPPRGGYRLRKFALLKIYVKETTASRAGPSQNPTKGKAQSSNTRESEVLSNTATRAITKPRTTRNSTKTAQVTSNPTVPPRRRHSAETPELPRINTINKKMPDPVRMPAPGTKDAPKFDKERPSELNRFISRMEDWFAKAGVTDGEERIVALGKYADVKSEKEWKYLKTYDGKDWMAFKKELQGEYVEALDEELGSLKELRRICKAHHDIYSTDLAELQDLKREFLAEAKCLLKAPATLSNREAVDKFLDCLSDEFCDKILSRLEVAQGSKTPQVTRRAEDRYDLDETIEMAITIA